ncbi:uncharacterized protein LOC142230959 [Haematobia irritans]|uniref:uncharacterized protein LOC142230959 n=1 Tax=Haematobia irritans TaxID=7368 RepID=UPI003F4FC45E
MEGGKRSFNVVFHNVTCPIFDHSLMKHLECDLLKLNTSRYAFNVMFELKHNMPDNVVAAGLIHVRPSNGLKIIKFVDIKWRVCDLLWGANSPIPLAKDIVDKVRRNSELPLSCPVLGNKMYNITNLIITTDIFPVYTPIINFNLTIDFYNSDKFIVSYRVRGSTVAKK